MSNLNNAILNLGVGILVGWFSHSVWCALRHKGLTPPGSSDMLTKGEGKEKEKGKGGKKSKKYKRGELKMVLCVNNELSMVSHMLHYKATTPSHFHFHSLLHHHRGKEKSPLRQVTPQSVLTSLQGGTVQILLMIGIILDQPKCALR